MSARTRESFEDTLRAASIRLDELVARADGTVGTTDVDPPSSEAALAALPPLSVTGGSGELRLGEVIGEGGMGIVHAAEQTSLRREVAVKTLREESRSPAHVADFVREARVTGALAHPNVVPIHGIGVDEHGGPRIIMKRVEGRSWLTQIEEPFGQPERVEPHLEIALGVCRALEMAHARGILHRDVKPENVLVGPFGEVLLVDWGLAVRFRDDAEPSDVPHCASVSRIVGTPRYMSPEMATGDGHRLGPATDVYLLGATLHHALTGESRHQGTNLMAVLYQAYASPPHDYGSSIPEELGGILNRACAPEPEDRYPSVEALRRALLDYRAHAGSRELAAEAWRRLERAEELETCRFGFEQALAAWPANADARRGLQRTLESLAERALARDALSEAESILGALAKLDAGDTGPLRARLATLRADLDRRASQIAALERDAHERDLGLAADSRRAYGIAFGLILALYNMALGASALTGTWKAGFLEYVLGAAMAGGLVGAVALLRLPNLLPNRAARRLLLGLGAIVVAQVPVFLALGWLGVSIERALAVSLLQLSGSYAIKSFAVDERTLWVAAAPVALGDGSFFVPAASWFSVGASYAGFFVTGSLLSFREEDERP